MRITFVLLLAATLGGCLESPPTPTIENTAQSDPSAQHTQSAHLTDTEGVRLEQQKLDADTLAEILGVQAWTFRYRGGPVRCWLELEEVGQDTMASRIPPHTDLKSSDAEGEIVFSLRPLEDGGEFRLKCGDKETSYGITKNKFTYRWPHGSSMSHSPLSVERTFDLEGGKQIPLVSFTAQELVLADEETPRAVTVTLLAGQDTSEEDSESSPKPRE